MERKNVLTWIILGISFVFLTAGAFMLQARPQLFATTTPFALLFFAIVAVTYAPKWKYALIFAGTFLIEALGVATGFPFGQYYYTSALGPLVLGVPLLIGINWVWVSIGATQLARRFKFSNKYYRAIMTGCIVVLFDVLLEPVAIKLGWWVWPNGVGVANYASWFVIGALASLFIDEEDTLLFSGLLLIQVIFFVLIMVI